MTQADREIAALLRRNPDLTLTTDATGYTTPAARQVARAGVRRITLDYPPSANRYWRVGKSRNGATVIYRSEAATEYIRHVGEICSTAGISLLEGDVGVVLRVYRPRRKGDLDNRIKIVLDALQGYAYRNDEQVARIEADRLDDKDCPRVEIEIHEMEPQP